MRVCMYMPYFQHSKSLIHFLYIHWCLFSARTWESYQKQQGISHNCCPQGVSYGEQGRHTKVQLAQGHLFMQLEGGISNHQKQVKVSRWGKVRRHYGPNTTRVKTVKESVAQPGNCHVVGGLVADLLCDLSQNSFSLLSSSEKSIFLLNTFCTGLSRGLQGRIQYCSCL